jgi:hypothetical protein
MEDVGAEGIVKVGNSKRIDMDCQWMQNYKASAGRKQRRHTPSPAAQNRGSGGIAPTIDGLPTLDTLNHYEQFEKVRKMQIDNETKLGNLTANQFPWCPRFTTRLCVTIRPFSIAKRFTANPWRSKSRV